MVAAGHVLPRADADPGSGSDGPLAGYGDRRRGLLGSRERGLVRGVRRGRVHRDPADPANFARYYVPATSTPLPNQLLGGSQPAREILSQFSVCDGTVPNTQNNLLAGLIARRIVTFKGEGEALGVGERFGLIRFGSRMDVFLPVGTKLRVKVKKVVTK